MGTTKVLQERDFVGGSTTKHVYPITSDLAVYNLNNKNLAKFYGVINLDVFNAASQNYTSKQTARDSINEIYRHNGLVITYRLNGSWCTEQFIADYESIADWNDDANWSDFGSDGSAGVGTLDTTEYQSLTPGIESFSDVINLHAVSKTGRNTDLIDYVGKVVHNNDVAEEGIVFNDYDNNHASGKCSTAFGYNTLASGNYQVALGKYNINDLAGKYAFVIGNGSSNSSRENIVNINWSGVLWSKLDVCCGGTFAVPEHKLSDKFDVSSLEYDYTEGGDKPAASEAVYNLYRLINGSKSAYSFTTLTEMVTDPDVGLNNVESDVYTQGSQLLVSETGVSDYWITGIDFDHSEPYTWSSEEQFEEDVLAAGILQVGYYYVAKLETGSVNLSEYVKKTDFKTINSVSIFDEVNHGGNIAFPTVVNTVEADEANAVSSDAVYRFVTENSISTESLKVLNTDNDTELTPTSNEILYNNGTINLHKISKTGKNTDLIGFVGMRVSGVQGAEIFNDYVGNTCTGANSHVEGSNNTCSGAHCHVSGTSNTATNNYCNVFGLRNNASKQCQTVFGKYNENKGNTIFEIGWGESASVRGNLFDINYTGKVWSKNTVSIGTMDSETGIPDITVFDNNDLVTKYYVDTHSGSLFGGVVKTNSDLDSDDPDGTVFIVKSNNCVLEDDVITATNIINIKIGSKWYGHYDVLKFTDDTDLIHDTSIIGGTKAISASENYNTPIYLHNIAKTGSWNDLKDKPEISGGIIAITYSELYTLYSTSQLSPGTYYRITDYNTTTVQENTQSAGHQFDLIVHATTSSTLDYQAKAVLHEGDTYFSTNNADLSKWQIWYNIENNTSKYRWADTENGKGVIYRMIDEWENDCPYDFKNIQFNVGEKEQAGTIDGVYYYTFSLVSGENDSTVEDFSIVNTKRECNLNKISPVIFYYLDQDRVKKGFRILCSNIFRNTNLANNVYRNTLIQSNGNIFGASCNNNTLDKCYDNIFGSGFSNNRIADDCRNNVFGSNCSYNSIDKKSSSNNFGDNCSYNSLGFNCSSNTFGSKCSYNTLEAGCNNNSFSSKCIRNILYKSCKNCNFSNYCLNNICGYECNLITFGESCQSNIIDDSCVNITFSTGCCFNKIEQTCSNIVFAEYSYYNIIHMGCSDINFLKESVSVIMDSGCGYMNFDTSDDLAFTNVHIKSGISGSMYDKINITIEGNLDYETIVAKNSRGEIKIYCEADLIQ